MRSRDLLTEGWTGVRAEDAKAADSLRSRSISVVLPAHNEEAVIGETIAACHEALSGLQREYEIVVVDDGSIDATGEIIDALAATHPDILVVHNRPRKGYGGALTAGFNAATKDLIFFMDSDGQFDPREIGYLLTLSDRGFPAVLGWRRTRTDSPIRLINAKGWNLVVSLVFSIKVRDIDCGFKLYDAVLIRAMATQGQGAIINTEMLAKLKKMGVRPVEVPVTHYPRRNGVATGANVFVVLKAFRDLVSLRLKLRHWVPPTVGHWPRLEGGRMEEANAQPVLAGHS